MLERCRRVGMTWVPAKMVLTALACAEAESRPGLAADCNDPVCIDARGGGVVLPGQSSGDTGGSAGAAGSGNMPGAGAGTVAGTVREVAALDLQSSRSLQRVVRVLAPDATASQDPLSTETGNAGMFRLEGVRQGNPIWVGVGAFEQPPIEPFIDTLQAVDSTKGDFIDLLVLRRDLFTDLVAASFINNPVELAEGGAHIVIQFVDEARAPLSGVSITYPPPDQISTAYDAGEIYSDALQATATRGMAVLVNLSAPPFPGTSTSIIADVNGELRTTNLQIAEDAVTVVTAVISDP